MYLKTGRSQKSDLHRTRELCQALGNPQQDLKAIHIAGTNAKGSTSHALAAVLQVAGYKTGLYTSPHLKSFRERMRINGSRVQESYIVWFITQYKSLIEAIKPTYFELSVAMAYKLFAKEQVDIAVIEVGMGGRLDATNVITPLLAIITNISFDHREVLGDSLQAIAYEKAGIIKPGIPVIIGNFQPETMPIFEQVARQCQAPLQLASAKYRVQLKSQQPQGLLVDIYQAHAIWLQDLCFNLGGLYQCDNIPAILCAIEKLVDQGYLIKATHIRQGLRYIKQLTGLRGRWEVLAKAPLTICDTGHNQAAIAQIMDQLTGLTYKNLHIVWGMNPSKDWLAILQLLPKQATYYFCQAKVHKSMDVYQLAKAAAGLGLQGTVIPTVQAAYKQAQSQASQADVIFIGGSTYVVAEVL